MGRISFTGGETNLVRVRPHALIGMGLAIHTPSIVWSGTIDTAPTFPADGTGVGTLVVTTATGAFTAVREGMTVIIGGTYYTYARKAPTGATSIFIDGLGAGTITITGGVTIFQVYDEFLPWPRRHRYDTGVWYNNFDLAYSDQNTDFWPQAVMGPAAIIYKDGSVNFAFDGTRSIAHAPGATITDYLWTFPDASTSTSATPTFTTSTAYPNGAYVHLEVTDDNGNTHTGHRLLWKFDSSNKPRLDFTINTLVWGGWGEGCYAEIMSPDLDLDGGYTIALNHVCLFGTTAYGTTVQNIGSNFPGRQNIWIEGWITSTENETSADSIEYTYTINTIDALLRDQISFPLAIDDVSPATTWLEMDGLTLDQIAWHVCRWRSTIGDVCDVTFIDNTASTRAKFGMDLAYATLWDQLKQVSSWLVGGNVSVDHEGAIYIEQDAIVAGTTASLPAIVDIFYNPHTMAGPYTRVDTPRFMRKTAKFSTYGVDYDIPVGSRAPDDPIAHGASTGEIAAGIHATQTELNLWTGNARLQQDNVYGARRYPLVGIIRVDPTPQCTVGITAVGATNMVVRSCEWEFDPENGMAWCTIELERKFDATAIAGRTISFDIL